jgi:hypothetical protein
MNRGLASVYVAVMMLGFFTLSMGEETVQQRIVMEVAEISVLAVSGDPGKLTVIPPSSGGQGYQNAVDSSTSIQYSSTVRPNQYRALTVRWGMTGSAPAGCVLKLQAVSSGRLNEGNSTGEIILSLENQIILTGIGSCASGVGPDDGARLVYTLSVVDMTQLSPGESNSATVILTLSDIS